MAIKYGTTMLMLLAFGNVCYSIATNTNDVLSPTENTGEPSRILSRRKRFLVFPDGSSFQLVFCTQNHGYIQVGDIVWFGNTAALAWQLPTDPKFFYLFKDHEKAFAQNRDGTSKHIYYLNEDGKVLSKVPYKRKFIVSPVFAKRNIDERQLLENQVKAFDIKGLHERQMKTKYLEYLDEDSKEFHREGRVDLFPKLEKFLEGLGWRGKECVLRMLCESSKENTRQGTFLEEILRAAFTLPPGKEFVDQEHKEYDKAHRSNGDCVQLYPQCTTLREFSEINNTS